MIVAGSGWRFWGVKGDTDPLFIHGHLDRHRYLFGPALHLRIGDCEGADEIMLQWAKANPNVSFTIYRADWATHGRPAAGPIRNNHMLRGAENPDDPYPDVLANKLLAFPQPGVKMRSPGSGTTGCVIEANFLGVDVDIPGYKPRDFSRGEQ